MLQSKELNKLFQIINNKQKSLEEIQDRFLDTFKDCMPVFQASYTLSHLLNHNLLTLQQRIITLFLLIQNFKSEGIKKNPFGATVLNFSEKTTQGFERRMISDLILQGKRQKYETLKLEELLDDQQHMVELTPERQQIKKIREEFYNELPKISQKKTSQVLNLIPDPNAKKSVLQPPEEFSPNTVKNNLCFKDFAIGNLRPIPKFIQINPFEMCWLSSGIITDVHWDNSNDLQKKFIKTKGYIKRGLQSKLSKEQTAQIDRCLQNQAYAVLHLDLTPENLLLLINNNPYVAASFLVKLGNYTIIGQYFEKLLDCNISLNCIDVVVRLIKYSKIPIQFIQTFILKNLKQSQGLGQNHRDFAKMGRIITKFILTMKRNTLIDLNQINSEIKDFINHFKNIEQVQFLEKQLFNLKHDNQLK